MVCGLCVGVCLKGERVERSEHQDHKNRFLGNEGRITRLCRVTWGAKGPAFVSGGAGFSRVPLSRSSFSSLLSRERCLTSIFRFSVVHCRSQTTKSISKNALNFNPRHHLYSLHSAVLAGVQQHRLQNTSCKSIRAACCR